MLRYQQGKVGVLCLLVGSFVAVAVYGDDAVGVLIYNDTVGIIQKVRTESSNFSVRYTILLS